MSKKYPWLPEMIAAPLRRVRNSLAFRYEHYWRRPTKAEMYAVEEELRVAKAELAAKHQQYYELTKLVADAARACRTDPVADAAFKWLSNNEYVLSGAKCWGKKTEQSYQELIEAVDKVSNRESAR
jgi:hypothetical protein